MVAHRQGLLIPKLRRQIAEFLQHRSLKRLGILYLSTCVGFGYGLTWRLFPGTPSPPNQSDKVERYTASVTIHWPGNNRPVPIDYAFRPRLRGRLTLRRLTLRRNPWTFGESVFHTLCRNSCQHSHFPYLQKPSRVFLQRPRERSATTHLLRSESEASARGLSPVTFSAQDPLFRPVSCYAFFKGWLLLSQPPGCFGIPTSFPT